MISVCMATYNGEKYIQRQLESILCQLDSLDEVIIVDDCSKDKTVNIIKEINDSRIRINKNSRQIGVNKTFEKTLYMANGELIFLSDQDDIWLPNKVKVIKKYFKKHNDVDIIQHDAAVETDDGVKIAQSFFRWRGHVGPGIFRNFIRDTHLGCCMAMRKSVLKDCLPITEIPYHDKWIGIISMCTGHKMVFLPVVLLRYIRHSGTTTSPRLRRRNISIIIVERLKYMIEVIRFLIRKKALGKDI